MSTTVATNQFTSELLMLLTETFESVQGIFLDKGTSLIETLAGITAQEASIPVGNKCATIAAQVTHLCFYLDVLYRFIQTGQNERVDWGEIWQTVSEVTPEEWDALCERVRQTYERTKVMIQSYDRWETENSMGGTMAVAVHAAYHLGEIRQALCIIKK